MPFWEQVRASEAQDAAALGTEATPAPAAATAVVRRLSALARVEHPALSVLVGAFAQGRRQLVLTVHGQRDGAPALEALAAAAPPLGYWRVVRYLPASGATRIAVRERVLDAADIDVYALASPLGRLALMVFLPDAGDPALRDAWREGLGAMLFHALGEELFLTRIDQVKVLSGPPRTREACKLTELRGILERDGLVSRPATS